MNISHCVGFLVRMPRNDGSSFYGTLHAITHNGRAVVTVKKKDRRKKKPNYYICNPEALMIYKPIR